MSDPRPFLDFYGAHGISPVRQDIQDRARHLQRRRSLYRHLGIPPGLVRGKRVLEFGPGSGHNAIFTASLGPERYLLVEGNPTGARETRELLGCPGTGCSEAGVEVVEGTIEDFESEERFDLVLCEGLLPFQLDPGAMARHVAGFARPEGLVVVTCADGVSFLSETLRRLVGWRVAPLELPVVKRADLLVEAFGPHLATIPGMSRPHRDWVYDNLLQPFVGHFFSIADALDALHPEYEFYGASPAQFVDWRWYKILHGDQTRFHEHTREQFLANLVNGMDYRVLLSPQDPEIGAAILEQATALFHDALAAEASPPVDLPPFATRVRQLEDLVRPLSPSTADSLEECAAFLEAAAPSLGSFESFRGLFGRGQSYLSFLRLPS